MKVLAERLLTNFLKFPVNCLTNGYRCVSVLFCRPVCKCAFSWNLTIVNSTSWNGLHCNFSYTFCTSLIKFFLNDDESSWCFCTIFWLYCFFEFWDDSGDFWTAGFPPGRSSGGARDDVETSRTTYLLFVVRSRQKIIRIVMLHDIPTRSANLMCFIRVLRTALPDFMLSNALSALFLCMCGSASSIVSTVSRAFSYTCWCSGLLNDIIKVQGDDPQQRDKEHFCLLVPLIRTEVSRNTKVRYSLFTVGYNSTPHTFNFKNVV